MSENNSSLVSWIRLFAYAAILVIVVVGLKVPVFGGFEIGTLLDPVDGLYKTARTADVPVSSTLRIDGLSEEVEVLYDNRGVPHIYAQNDRDLIITYGYVVARDRLFELDFIPRAAAGRLSEVFGESAITTDRFFRSIGMEWGAKQSLDSEFEAVNWFQHGANAFISGLSASEYPLEMRLLGYSPKLLEPLDAMLLQQYLTYDLSFQNPNSAYNELRSLLGQSEYEKLFPRFSRHFEPIVPPLEAHWNVREQPDEVPLIEVMDAGTLPETQSVRVRPITNYAGTVAEGYRDGIGSNNWAVNGSMSETGFPILAGDMHLNLSLPSIWYEAHLVSPEMNVYGVTFPGAPGIVEGITPTTAWAFTNTGTDQIDHYELEVDSTGLMYRIGDNWEAFAVVFDTIKVAGSEPVVDRRLFSSYGPVMIEDDAHVAIRWVGHETSRSMSALWEMARASSYTEFEDATRQWGSPMQNILYADRADTVAIRSTGHLPIREGGSGFGVLDGSSGEYYWNGSVPFDELPRAINPRQGFLSSTNQQPTDSSYPYYLGSNWSSTHRSLRINELLNSKEIHSVSDIRSYQSDVFIVQAEQFIPFMAALDDLSEDGNSVLQRFIQWDRNATVRQIEPTLFRFFLDELERRTWDEAVFQDRNRPRVSALYDLMLTEPASPWFDIQATTLIETGPDLIRLVLEETGRRYARQIRENPDFLRWGNQHRIVFKHFTRSESLSPLWRGDYPYPGFSSTLSPASSRMNTHSASWRVVVDFSTVPPNAFGVYPGGQSGNPFSERYDGQIDTYLAFEYYPLILAPSPEKFPSASLLSKSSFRPVE